MVQLFQMMNFIEIDKSLFMNITWPSSVAELSSGSLTKGTTYIHAAPIALSSLSHFVVYPSGPIGILWRSRFPLPPPIVRYSWNFPPAAFNLGKTFSSSAWMYVWLPSLFKEWRFFPRPLHDRKCIKHANYQVGKLSQIEYWYTVYSSKQFFL